MSSYRVCCSGSHQRIPGAPWASLLEFCAKCGVTGAAGGICTSPSHTCIHQCWASIHCCAIESAEHLLMFATALSSPDKPDYRNTVWFCPVISPRQCLLHLLCTKSMLFIIPPIPDGALHTGHCSGCSLALTSTWHIPQGANSAAQIQPCWIWAPFRVFWGLVMFSQVLHRFWRQPDSAPCSSFPGRFFYPPVSGLSWRFWLYL